MPLLTTIIYVTYIYISGQCIIRVKHLSSSEGYVFRGYRLAIDPSMCEDKVDKIYYLQIV